MQVLPHEMQELLRVLPSQQVEGPSHPVNGRPQKATEPPLQVVGTRPIRGSVLQLKQIARRAAPEVRQGCFSLSHEQWVPRELHNGGQRRRYPLAAKPIQDSAHDRQVAKQDGDRSSANIRIGDQRQTLNNAA
jgi:hypothetical protein